MRLFKNYFSVLTLLLLPLLTISQVPMSFNYQAVLRNDAGEIMASEDVTIEVALLQGGVDGTEVFTESHPVQTNDYGLVNLKIGSVNSLEDVDWKEGDVYIRISVDGTEMGTTPLLSVPFALHALSSADVFSGDYEDLENLPDMTGYVAVEDPQSGDMFYFSEGAWQALSMGQEGQVLMVVDGKPQWGELPEEGDDDDEDGTVTDFDGNVYNTLEMGGQTWMASNLKVTHYRDGTPIPGNLSNSEWNALSTGAYAVQPHDNVAGIDSEEEMIAAYGLQYNWFAVADERKLCPTGWKVPSDEEWDILNNFINSDGHPGQEGNAVKSCRQVDSPLGGDCDTGEHPRWNAHATNYGIDAYDFGALPGGFRRDDGPFLGLGANGYWWSSSVPDEFPNNGWYRAIRNYNPTIDSGDFDKRCGFYVRCVKETE